MILLPQWLSQTELWAALELAKYVEYTTVRGPFKMAPLEPEHLLAVPPAIAFLGGQRPYGAYIIRYAVGAEKAPHVDPPTFAKDGHDRIVCLLQAPGSGGTLRFEGEPVSLGVRDGVQFRADLISHSIDTVTEGERIVLTVGRFVGKDP